MVPAAVAANGREPRLGLITPTMRLSTPHATRRVITEQAGVAKPLDS